MNNYIDAEKLKAEIKERLHCNGSFDECGDTAWDYDQGMVAAYNYILSLIDSLQQEQPKVDFEKEIDLDDEITKYWKDISSIYGAVGKEITRFDFDDACKYFYELGLKERK